ncbi:MAG TPA: MFS transporter, partial [Nocardioides sp.]|nr:MFS transporter [Nocardioides sp.]
TQTFTDRGKEFAAAAAGLPQPSPEQARTFAEVAPQQILTEGSTQAFLVGSILMLAASVVIWIFLDVKHEELATDGPEGVHVG